MAALVRRTDKKMKKLLQINPVLRQNTSTGRIMQEIGELAARHGWKTYMAYSKGRDGIQECQSEIVPVGNKWSTLWHGVETRLFDRHGLASKGATRQFVKRVEEIQPDVVHIHNIHGYFLNYPILFDYLAGSGVPVIWTVHDCWLYTGHCYYYSFARCDRWKTGCHDCPQKKEFPASWLFDRSRRNFADKQEAFTRLGKDQLTIVPVSEWIKGEMQQSFLKEYPFQVIHNGINTEVFQVYDAGEVRRRYQLEGKRIFLGVASIWSREKGLYDFIQMADMLNEEEVIVLVGVKPEERKLLPGNVVGIARTENIRQLAELYAAAEAFVNPTWQDNYPTVNLEAIACGTPVVTYRTGGSVEAVTVETGCIVEQGDVRGLLEAARAIARRGKAFYQAPCREYALKHFRKEDRYLDYLDLYERKIRKG